MKFKERLILRHKNPIGLALRICTYLGIGISLWFHHILLIFILLIIDLLNWFCMPMVNPSNELTFVSRIVKAEINWIKSHWGFTKILTVIIGFLLFGFLGVGLWTHDWLILLISFVLLVLLKLLIVKYTA